MKIIERIDHKFSKLFKQPSSNAHTALLIVEIVVIKNSDNYWDDGEERQHGLVKGKMTEGVVTQGLHSAKFNLPKMMTTK